MGEIRSVSREFPATGSEGVDRGIRLINAEILRKMPWGDNWTSIRIGLYYSLETFGIVRSTETPGNPFFVGVCSGPWGVGDPMGRTWRATGVAINGNATTGAYDCLNGYVRVLVSGASNDYIRYVSNISRGAIYTVQTTGGSYETGGDPRNRVALVGTAFGGSSASSFYENSETPKRSAFMIDIFRQPYGSGWQARLGGCKFNTMTNQDLPKKSYLNILGSRSSVGNDSWYGIDQNYQSGTTNTTTAILDTRNAPMDHLDIYWDNAVFGLELWRLDLLKLA